MNIVYAMTRNLYKQIIPSLLSLVEHNPDAKIYILAEDDKIDLPVKAKIINVSGQKYFPETGVNYKSQFTYMAMMRACLADIFPKMTKCICLDVDTIILDDLTELWKTDVKGKWYAACPEYTGGYRPFRGVYRNIGVTVYNLTQIRKDKAVAKAVDYLNKNAVPYLEQDMWNDIGQDYATDIPVRFNESFCCGYTDNPAIVHYAGIKDWYDNKGMYRWEILARYTPHMR